MAHHCWWQGGRCCSLLITTLTYLSLSAAPAGDSRLWRQMASLNGQGGSRRPGGARGGLPGKQEGAPGAPPGPPWAGWVLDLLAGSGHRLLSMSVVGVRVLVLSGEAGGGRGPGQRLGPAAQFHGLQAAPRVGRASQGPWAKGLKGQVSRKPPKAPCPGAPAFPTGPRWTGCHTGCHSQGPCDLSPGQATCLQGQGYTGLEATCEAKGCLRHSLAPQPWRKRRGLQPSQLEWPDGSPWTQA